MQVRVAKNKQELEAIIELRYEILRKPWMQPASTASDELEDSSINAYIAQNEEVIACGRLQKNDDGKGQVRYMAVRADQQGKGLGRDILKFLEEQAALLGIGCVELQARENALDFYKKEGYVVIEKSFLLWGQIQHYLMQKQL